MLDMMLALALSMGTAHVEPPEPFSAVEALAALKGLEGRWEGYVMTPDGPKGRVDYRVTAGGSAVMEVQFPGSDHEMVTVYTLNGDDLVAKHYCSMGNQPEMKLDVEASTKEALRFVFVGGTNLEGAAAHVHGGVVRFDGDRLENEWKIHEGDAPAGATRFFLRRAEH